MITTEEYEEIMKDETVKDILNRFMTPKQIKFEAKEEELDCARKAIMSNLLDLQKKIYQRTQDGYCEYNFPCGKNKVLHRVVYGTLVNLGYKLSTFTEGEANCMVIHITW